LNDNAAWQRNLSAVARQLNESPRKACNIKRPLLAPERLFITDIWNFRE